jgi:hypothetical protein
MIKFTIPLKIDKRYGLNDNKGKHWGKIDKLMNEVHESTYYTMLDQEVPKKLFKRPVAIHISYNSNLDIDNHGLVTKWIIDILKGYLIVDDSRKYLKVLIQDFHSGKDVLVEIWEMEE